MKRFGTFMMVAGIVVALAGLVGFVYVGQSGIDGEFLDFAFEMGNAFGVNSYMSTSEKMIAFVTQNRIVLTISGMISFLAGLFVGKE